ncbi:hypothetical protein [Streptosporangium roseum]|uniref:Uncharacterized protein n=1 Tax=Streptosporangium roseum (strain ATCC 12428 / DSM 43021 / JCM 3005 / KCTC 9067 / NCIMB 10171 / NRRL 2505 / NI 9100) TaxID=479432 RepID=D2B688_STRRD|nr:hypothetical protein [Streptosporangium roseum]ACZ83801.1 hypothetical protein Sros_0787 [Streptosporangium roseum DSM 43021]
MNPQATPAFRVSAAVVVKLDASLLEGARASAAPDAGPYRPRRREHDHVRSTGRTDLARRPLHQARSRTY